MSIITRSDDAGIAVLTWDQPGSPVNTKSQAALAELKAHIEDVLADDAVTGVVIASGKKGFVAGGDLGELQRIAEPQVAEALVGEVQALLRKLEIGGKPVVAAINGAAMGGGLEVALACHHRIASEDASLGMPEVTLGLMPGAGGTQRLPRLIGAPAALPLMTGGKPISAAQALDIGLVDDIVPAAELRDAAVAAARTTGATQPWDQPDTPPDVPPADVFAQARVQCAERSGNAGLAEAAIIDVVETGLQQPFDLALETERIAFGKLVASTTAKNRIRLFFALNDAKAIRTLSADAPAAPLAGIAVVGGGTMGSGIAFTAAAAGLEVRLIEVDDAALSRGIAAITRTADRQVKAGRLDAAGRDAVLARVVGQTDYAGLDEVDAAIEAVVEIEAVKAQVLERLSRAVRPGVPVASNTSTQPITRLATYCGAPEAFIGAHFFGPVERMPLVEVIRGAETSDATLTQTLRLLKMLRKSPVVVRDGLGFFTSRVVASYTGEAMTMLGEGVPAEDIDKVATDFGMVIGPCVMNDMTGLPLLIDIFSSIRSDASRISNQGNRSVETLQALVEAGRTGRRDGQGIYDYPDGKPVAWPGLSALFPPREPALDRDVIQQRLMHAQALETVRAMEEGIVASATDADVGSVLGWMFPRSYGGVIAYVDTVGVQRFVDECDRLTDRFGGRFTVPQSLREMARDGRRFHDI